MKKYFGPDGLPKKQQFEVLEDKSGNRSGRVRVVKFADVLQLLMAQELFLEEDKYYFAGFTSVGRKKEVFATFISNVSSGRELPTEDAMNASFGKNINWFRRIGGVVIAGKKNIFFYHQHIGVIVDLVSYIMFDFLDFKLCGGIVWDPKEKKFCVTFSYNKDFV